MSLSTISDFYLDDKLELPDQAYQSYDEVKGNGQPAQPLDFPTPIVHNAKFIEGRAMDHRQGKVYVVSVLTRSCMNDRKIGYLVKKKIANTVYGCIRLCVVLRQRHKFNNGGVQDAEWISTDEFVAIKASSWSKIKHMRGKHLEDPIKEAAALQLVGNYHPHVLGSLETLQDSEYLYLVMPYCSGGNLYSHIRNEIKLDNRDRQQRQQQNQKIISPRGQKKTVKIDRSTMKSCDKTVSTSTESSSSQPESVDENQARIWFRQLLDALVHLQRKGICHRHLCLENILLESNNDLVIIDFGIALRVPFQDQSNRGGISDASEGSDRLLMKAQGQCGSLSYLDPVIYEGEPAFDGYAADLWSAGVLLFTFLIGLAPFRMPSPTDYCFRQITRGKLRELMATNLTDITISDEACDLLQNMLRRDPRKRLTLAQVMEHPWVVGSSVVNNQQGNNIGTLYQLSPENTQNAAAATASSAFYALFSKGMKNKPLAA